MLTKEEIIVAKDIKTKILEVPEWGGQVTIQAMTFKDFTDIEIASRGVNGTRDIKKSSVAIFVAGVLEPKFEAKDIEIISGKNSAVITMIVGEINKLSGLGTDQKKD